MKKTLKQLEWMQPFRTDEKAHILKKSALRQGENKIGVLNPFGQIIYLDENTEVIEVKNAA